MTIHWKAVESYFTVEPFFFQFYTVCNFGKLVTVSSEGLIKRSPKGTGDSDISHGFDSD